MKQLFVLKLIFCCAISVLLSNQSSAQRLSAQHKAGQLLVAFDEKTDVIAYVAMHQWVQNIATQLQIGRQVSPQSNIWLLKYNQNSISEMDMLMATRRSKEVREAQFNHLLTNRNTVPNDSLLAKQWQWTNTGQTGGTADADLDAEQAWDITTGGLTALGDTIVVAIIDDGIDFNHPDLKNNLWINHAEIPNNGIDDDGNGYIDDVRGWNPDTQSDDVGGGFHGVEVAGMIGAQGNNTKGVTGINWRVKMMIIGYNSTDEADVIESYSYALKQRQLYNQSNGTKGAYVVATNSSWGINEGQPSEAPLWCAFYDTLGVHGILSCGATSNSSVNVDVVGDLPTACPSEFLIAVTATDAKDFRNFSAFGLENVDVAAPGDNVFTTATTQFGTGYTLTSGTSFACPTTAGLIALLYSAPCSNIIELSKINPAEAAKQIRNALFAGVDVKPNLQGEIKYGGRINAYNSLLKLLETCGPCPKPSALGTSVLLDTSATLTWIPSTPTVTTNLRYRKLGAAIWTTNTAVSAPFVVHNLQECTNYEFQVDGICMDSLSGWTNSYIFKTDGCCLPPSNISQSVVYTPNGTPTENQVFFKWKKVLKAKKYSFQYKIDPATAWTTELVNIGISDSVLFSLYLPTCKKIIYRIASVCDNSGTLSDYSPEIIFNTKGCGACLDNVYCASAGVSSNSEWIKFVRFRNIINTSGNNNGYKFFDNQTTSVNIATNYNIFLTAGFPSTTGFQEKFRVWIDYNQDGDFDDDGELAFDPPSTMTSSAGVISIPTSAIGGLTRMRVSMKYVGFQASEPTECEEFPFGEVEDYCITIINFIPCAAVTGLNIVKQSGNSAKLFWNDAATNIGYIIQSRKKSSPIWDEVSDTANFYIFNGLICDTLYEFRVKTICGNDLSDFSPAVTYKGCNTTATKDVIADYFRAQILPNPFSESLKIKLKLSQATSQILLKLVDLQGHEIWSNELKKLSEGNLEYDFEDEILRKMPSGIYFLKIISSELGKSEQLKLVKM